MKILDCFGIVGNYSEKAGPLVSVLIPTYNRRRYLPVSLSSVVHQDYSNLEIFVIRDGGEDVSDIVNSFNDHRIIFINRKENRGLPFTLNEALLRARGKYICYLGDDDRYYPHHVNTLLDILERQDECQVAYSDLYKNHCRVMPDGSRVALSKVVQVSRDFDRFFMLYFNHVLNVGMMHHSELLEKTGLYNENLNVLIDWDITRRAVFFTDFIHTYEITGEFYAPVGDCDRISIQRRKDKHEYIRNVLEIRTTRPGKPWPKLADLSIIFNASRLNKQAAETLYCIWQCTFFPYQVYMPLPQAELDRLDTSMPNVIKIAVDSLASEAERVDAALARCEGEYIVIVPSGFAVGEMWVEDPLYALINSSVDREALELGHSTDELWAVVARKGDLQYARRSFPNLPVHESMKAAGIITRRLRPEEIPFQFDELFHDAKSAEKDGDWAEASQIFEYIAEHYQNELLMKARAAKAFFKAGSHARAGELSRELNQQRPMVDTLLLEAKVSREKGNFNSAMELLERAEQILEGKELLWT